MRAFILLTMCMSAAPAWAAEPNPLPVASQTKLEQPKTVGHTVEPAQLAADAERIRKELTETLAHKRQQADALLEEIRQLEAELGRAKMIQVKVLALELDPGAMTEIRQTLAIEKDAPMVILSEKQRRDIDQIVKRFESQRKVKVLADTALVTNDGRPATMRAGEEFPVISPTKGNEPAISYQSVGTLLETLPTMITSDRLKLDVAYEETRKDASSAVSLNGQVVPGLSVRRVNTQVEMKLGETAVCGGLHLQVLAEKRPSTLDRVRRAASSAIELASGEMVKQESVFLVLVTPEAIQPVVPSPKSQ
jgi:Flp pilus assembly secretin CpaC